jgi:predicted O-methyltransferase YrrM
MKSYLEINGWFNHKMTYDYLIEQCPEQGTIVELGAWLGKSSSYLVDKAINKNVIIIDSWLGSPNELQTNHKLALEKDIYELFKSNMGNRKYRSIRGLSKDIVNDFEDESLDVVFIDLTHTYEEVKQDITFWLPKVKKGGILSGHDYEIAWEGVIKAVDEMLPTRTIMENCWIYKK